MKLILTTLLIMVASASFCQNSTVIITGKIIDSASHAPLEMATVTVYNAADTTLLAYYTSNTNGSFKVPGLPHNKGIKIVISFSGYRAYTKVIKTGAGELENLGTIEMLNQAETMEEVIVSAEKPPVTVNKDTTEYNATRYKMPPNSMVEDLLKKLPGVSVSGDGTVKAQGQKVEKVLVDGKEFFGNDPKMATKNLTSEMIESVQVFDDKSDQSKFTKIDDGSRSKTINLKLKKGFKNGLFGRAELGYGDQDRYQGDLSMNSFSGDRRISFMFNANNLSRQGFSSYMGQQFVSVMGGMISARDGGSGGGLGKSLRTGLNFSDQWGPLYLFQF
jgi:hypothetical protein